MNLNILSKQPRPSEIQTHFDIWARGLKARERRELARTFDNFKLKRCGKVQEKKHKIQQNYMENGSAATS